MGKVLIACEESQAVCKEFRALGHEAYSCDVQMCSGGHPEWHILGDVLPVLEGYRKVKYANECEYDEFDVDREFPFCNDCNEFYVDCGCPGPTQDLDYIEIEEELE